MAEFAIESRLGMINSLRKLNVIFRIDFKLFDLAGDSVYVVKLSAVVFGE